MPILPPATESICLFRLSALGDVVLVLPLVRAIQAHKPDAKLTWVIAKGAYPLVAGLAAEGIEFVVLEKPNGLGDYVAIHHRLSERRFSTLLCLQASWRANTLYPLIKADRKIGYRADRAKDLHRFFVRESIEPRRNHIADAFLQFGEMIGVPAPAVPEWRLPVDPAARAWAEKNLPAQPFLAINPCASKAERNWSVENYATVARSLRERHGLEIVLVGGPTREEKSVAASLATAIGGAINLVGGTSLSQLVATLERCRLLLAPDTGAVHIANALGRPVVGLYTSAQCPRTGPYRHPEFCVDHYREAVQKFMRKDPDRELWELRVHDSRAMDLITVEEVMGKAEEALRKEVASSQ
ncbi:MAG TPA: glycosyltransferase family 9 protein [Candidatus Didemnitutus sp.]|nr:glycosyltransferase family 9 protein [Candidatus Didemnitutus sp.]